MAEKKSFIERYNSLYPTFKERYSHTLELPAYGQAVNAKDGNPIPGYENVRWAGNLTVFAHRAILNAYDMYRIYQARKNNFEFVKGDTGEQYLNRAVEAGIISPDPLIEAFGKRKPNRAALLYAMLKHKTNRAGNPSITVNVLLYFLGGCSYLANRRFDTPRAQKIFEEQLPGFVSTAHEFVDHVPHSQDEIDSNENDAQPIEVEL